MDGGQPCGKHPAAVVLRSAVKHTRHPQLFTRVLCRFSYLQLLGGLDGVPHGSHDVGGESVGGFQMARSLQQRKGLNKRADTEAPKFSLNVLTNVLLEV